MSSLNASFRTFRLEMQRQVLTLCWSLIAMSDASIFFFAWFLSAYFSLIVVVTWGIVTDLIMVYVEVLASPSLVDLQKATSFTLLSTSCASEGSGSHDSHTSSLKPITSKSVDSNNDSPKAIFQVAGERKGEILRFYQVWWRIIWHDIYEWRQVRKGVMQIDVHGPLTNRYIA